MLETKYIPKYEHMRIIYKFKKDKSLEELSKKFNVWVRSIPRPEGEWQIMLGYPATGENNPIAVCDLEVPIKTQFGHTMQTKGLDGLLESWEFFYLIRSRTTIINQDDVKNPRKLATFLYVLQEGKTVLDFLNWFEDFWKSNYDLKVAGGNREGVEDWGIYDPGYRKSDTISCHFQICNLEHWEKKMAEMKKEAGKFIDPPQTRTEFYSLIAIYPPASCVLNRSIDYRFDKIEKEKKDNGSEK
jgi:hypothetical protein